MYRQEALRIAIGEIGNGEEIGNNYGPHIEKYANGLAEPPLNWCAAFVSWCYWQASLNSDSYPMPFAYTLGARAIMNQIMCVDKVNPNPGDLIFFWRGSPDSWMGHVGIVYKATEKQLITIEGNKGLFPARVKYCHYERYNIPKFLGFGHINY